MYFWNLRALKRELIAGGIGEGRLFGYFFAVLIFDLVILYSYWLLPMSNINIWNYIGAVTGMCTTLIGTYIAWRLNGGTAGRNFFGRYFPLLWVLGVRFWVVILAIVLPVGLVSGIMAVLSGSPVEGGDGPSPWEPLVVAIGWAWLTAFYWRLAVHMRAVASAR